MNRSLSISSHNPASAELIRGVLAALPVMIGFLPFGLLLGAQAAQKGLSAPELMMMTGLNYAGGSEFAAIALWTSPPHVLTIVMVSLLVNSRHLLMGAALAPYLSHLPLRKALPALFFMCDESWALGMADASERRARGMTPAMSLAFYAGLAGALWLTWIISTGCGVLIGPALGDVTRWGFDMAFPAVFFVLLRGMWKGLRVGLPWLVSLIAAGATWHWVPGAAYVPVGALAGLATIFLMSKNA
ncbi:AzlC family ABC transporter permease [Nissabacter sp. SGAir0207]|uniref:AzlC family ABC transporter permease n=1 Tax=Nissabacter sp. SGAir0207 TaxID=2126321 RepID=UPI0010CCB7DD|nr:AzlC family ABC transporter permease [Nissabacter sp. SGAir0207]QCR38407.1 branched-chain amino acid ABC transporter permease [Nissabacter sp. SGAir0207]